MPEPIHVPTAEEVHAPCNARIAELQAALRYALGMLNAGDGAAYDVRPILEAALPDTEGELRPVRPGPHIAAMPWSNEQTDSFRPDTEGEQDG